MDVKTCKSFQGKNLINCRSKQDESTAALNIWSSPCSVRLFDNYTLPLLLYLEHEASARKILVSWYDHQGLQPGTPSIPYSVIHSTSSYPPPRSAIQILSGFCTPQDLGPATGQRHPGIYKLLIELKSEVLPLPLENTSVQEVKTRVSGSQCVGSAFACAI